MDTTSEKITKTLRLKAGAGEAEMVAAIRRLQRDAQPDPARLEKVVQDAIAFGIDSRRLLRVQRRWAEGYARKDPEGFVTYLTSGPEIGFASATDEYLAHVRRRIDESGRKREFAAALERVVQGHPDLIQEARTRLEFSAGAAVSDDDVVRELARRHPRLVEEARALVDASGVPLDYTAAMDAVARDHPELVEEVRAEREARMAAARVSTPTTDGPAATAFMKALEDVAWADGVDWFEAVRRVRERRPELVDRAERERAGTARGES